MNDQQAVKWMSRIYFYVWVVLYHFDTPPMTSSSDFLHNSHVHDHFLCFLLWCKLSNIFHRSYKDDALCKFLLIYHHLVGPKQCILKILRIKYDVVSVVLKSIFQFYKYCCKCKILRTWLASFLDTIFGVIAITMFITF